MKKLLLAILVALVAIGILTTGIVFAQAPQPTQTPQTTLTPIAPGNGGGMRGGKGGGMMGRRGNDVLHTYLDQALALKLNITDAQLQEKLTAGKTPYDVVADSGVAAADIPALLQEVHKTAIANAVAAGAITQAQADTMLQNNPDGMMGGKGGGMMGRNGNGAMRTYVDQALAQKLNITDAQLQEKLTAGKTPYDVVAESGVAVADIPALLQEVHKTAAANAVAAGAITQAQADAMLQHMQEHLTNGEMPCENGRQPGQGMGGGRGRGGRGGQQP